MKCILWYEKESIHVLLLESGSIFEENQWIKQKSKVA
jgi:hypothetical protein